jgi:hypothetical protein
MRFNPASIKTFSFVGTDFSSTDRTLSLHYALDEYHFAEVYSFPSTLDSTDLLDSPAGKKAINLLHLVAGISYFKAAVPGKIEILNQIIDMPTAQFMTNLYRQGLREFFHSNMLQAEEQINFPFSTETAPKASTLPLSRRSLVAVGGGKDSLVTIAALQEMQEPLVLTCIGSHTPILNVIAKTELPSLIIERNLDPLLLELNQHGAYNGHIPITAINSAVLLVAALLYDFDSVIMSNERSASAPTLIQNGKAVNHQFSKSWEFEQMLRSYLQNNVCSNLEYYSFLRPLSELAIAKEFALLKQYHEVFTSCNQAFRQAHSITRWCLNCPKCRFVYLILAPYLSPQELKAIFGHDLLDDLSQSKGFEDLLGLGEHKPFECVGEIQECLAAFSIVSTQTQWQHAAVLQHINKNFSDLIDRGPDYIAPAFHISGEHALPKRFMEFFNALS